MPHKTGRMTNRTNHHQMITARGLTKTFRSKGQTVAAPEPEPALAG